jgi:hypothetical protein
LGIGKNVESIDRDCKKTETEGVEMAGEEIKIKKGTVNKTH